MLLCLHWPTAAHRLKTMPCCSKTSDPAHQRIMFTYTTIAIPASHTMPELFKYMLALSIKHISHALKPHIPSIANFRP